MYKILLTIIILFAIPSTTHAMKFDGVDDGVTIGNINALHASSSDLTVSLWIKPYNLSAGVTGVFGMSGAGASQVPYMLEINRTAGRVSWSQAGGGVGTVSVTNTTNLTLGKWQHIVVTRRYNSTYDWTTNIYLNGLPNGSGTNGRSGGTSQIMAIGRYGGHTLYTNIEIADVRMYNRVLTPQEAKALYYGYDIYQGLISRWLLDGNSLPFVPNYSSASFNGTATGGASKATLPERLKLFK
jgi:Concanavalin A-like lectin/glucanases superfamily